MEKILGYFIGALGLWLIVAINVFSSSVALWIAFATAIAITAAASAATAVAYDRGQRLVSAVYASVAGLGAFLIVASLVFEGVSLGWLQAIAGGAIEFGVVGALTLPGSARPALAAIPTPAQRKAV